ncbi:hypothetical protein RHMOL_Rhmol09G0112500 [Rhododendron molle]|uniref:Uncharacterized protein n=1 Tax=Rhododendron molle TaxID=49168 RepID=A0ACC0MDB5_RHOML|nr:hypothetical protein RHMOL_Rhmol09G0112500 [Rhododendron molle]
MVLLGLYCLCLRNWSGQSRIGREIGFSSLYKFSLAASIYYIWGERNLRIFQGRSRDVAAVSLTIFNSIRAKANSWATVKFSAQNRGLCDAWLLDSRIFALNNC